MTQDMIARTLAAEGLKRGGETKRSTRALSIRHVRASPIRQKPRPASASAVWNGKLPPAGKIRQIGPAADVYSTGGLLYALLTGVAPFLADSSAETIRLVLNEDPVPHDTDNIEPVTSSTLSAESFTLRARCSPYGRRVPGPMENRAAVFASQPQDVEIYRANAWWPGSGFSRTSDSPRRRG